MLDEKELDDFTNQFLEEENQEIANEEAKGLTPVVQQAAEEDLSDGSNLWDGASEQQREEARNLQSKLAQAQHAADSDRGRNKALHAKVKKLEDENAARALAQSDQAQEPETTKQYTDEELSDMRDDLPEVSAIVSQETADLKKQLADIETRMTDNQEQLPVESINQEQIDDDSSRNASIELVEQAHPGFRDVIQTANYSTWLSRQASGVQQMARSQEADNAITVIDMFKSASNTKETDIELESMIDMPRKGLAKSNLASKDDFDAQFEHFSNQIEN